jgi:L-fucose isomerase-like protein
MPRTFSPPRPALGLPARGITADVLEDLLPPLPVPKPTRLVVIGCGTQIHFPWAKTMASYEAAIAQAASALSDDPFEVVRAPGPFEDPVPLLAFLDKQLAAGVGGIVLFHASYTTGELGLQLARWLTDHPVPVLSWSFPDVRGGKLEANSLCCQNFILGMFRQLGVRYAWCHAPVDAPAARETLGRFGRSARARDRFRHGKALHIGGSRVSGFYDCEADEFAVMKRLGLRFDRIDLQAAFDYARRFPERDLARLRDAIVNDPRCARNDVPDGQIFQTLRIGLTGLSMAAEQGYVGCTVKSWPELFDQYGCATDGSVSMMNDAGLCTAEEGDMLGLISSLALQLVSEGRAVPTMMDLSGLDAAADRIAIWHCGASPTRWLKDGATFEARKHSILENADPATAVGLMLEFLLQTGPATVVRYMAPGAARSFCFEGELVDCASAFRGNYAEMVPTAHTAEQIIGTIMSQGLDHHWSLAHGHWADDLRMLDHWTGVERVEVTHGGGTSGLSA